MSFWNGHRWEAQSPPAADVKSATPSRARRMGGAALEAALITALTFGLIAGSAFAARGGGKTGAGGGHHRGAVPTGSFSLVLVDSTDGVAHWSQHITFNVTSSATYPFVAVSCFQDGVRVYRQDIGFYVGWPWSQDFTLMSSAWTGGAADCSAELYSQNSDGSNHQTLSTMSFSAAA
jgi:hypothetical protein